MENKKKRKLITILAVVPLLLLLLGIVGGVTYALVTGTKTQTKHGFQVSVRGAVRVAATIEGSSYFNNVKTNDDVQVVVAGEAVTVVEGKDGGFDTAFDFDQNGDTAELVFEITNTTVEETYTDLIIAPSFKLEGADNLTKTLYFSETDSDYVELTDKYLTVAKGESIFVKLVIEIPEIDAKVDLTDGEMIFDLFTEDALPDDYQPVVDPTT